VDMRVKKNVLANRRTGRPVKMIVVFTPDEIPRPWKFKWSDGRKYEQTVIVDDILSTFQSAGYVQYECVSYYENTERRYQLIYWQEEYQWELYLK